MFFLIIIFNKNKLNGAEPLLFPVLIYSFPILFLKLINGLISNTKLNAISPSREHLTMSGDLCNHHN